MRPNCSTSRQQLPPAKSIADAQKKRASHHRVHYRPWNSRKNRALDLTWKREGQAGIVAVTGLSGKGRTRPAAQTTSQMRGRDTIQRGVRPTPIWTIVVALELEDHGEYAPGALIERGPHECRGRASPSRTIPRLPNRAVDCCHVATLASSSRILLRELTLYRTFSGPIRPRRSGVPLDEQAPGSRVNKRELIVRDAPWRDQKAGRRVPSARFIVLNDVGTGRVWDV
jgi:hypothetical protein